MFSTKSAPLATRFCHSNSSFLLAVPPGGRRLDSLMSPLKHFTILYGMEIYTSYFQQESPPLNVSVKIFHYAVYIFSLYIYAYFQQQSPPLNISVKTFHFTVYIYINIHMNIFSKSHPP